MARKTIADKKPQHPTQITRSACSILRSATEALDVTGEKLFSLIASECGANNPRSPSEPTKETLDRYSTSFRTSTDFKCSPRMADLIRAVLHKHRGKIPPERLDKWQAACAESDAVLAGCRELRYGHINGPAVGSEPGRTKDFARLNGAYAINRFDTADGGKARQELLLLEQVGQQNASTHATLISREIVYRGRFHITGRTIWTCMTGYRHQSKSDMVTIVLADDDGPEPPIALAGGAVGLASDRRIPAVMPLSAIRIADVSGSTMAIGNKADSVIRDLFASAIRDDPRLDFPTLPKDVLQNPLIGPELVQFIKDRIEKGEDLISPGIREFCHKEHQ